LSRDIYYDRPPKKGEKNNPSWIVKYRPVSSRTTGAGGGGRTLFRRSCCVVGRLTGVVFRKKKGKDFLLKKKKKTFNSFLDKKKGPPEEQWFQKRAAVFRTLAGRSPNLNSERFWPRKKGRRAATRDCKGKTRRPGRFVSGSAGKKGDPFPYPSQKRGSPWGGVGFLVKAICGEGKKQTRPSLLAFKSSSRKVTSEMGQSSGRGDERCEKDLRG